MKTFKKAFYLPLLFLIIPFSLFSWESIYGGRGNFSTDSDFHLLYGGIGYSVFGDLEATGNSILSSNNPTNANLITDITTYKTIDANFNSATYSLGDAEKMNSSSATLTLPSYVKGSDIVWAGLFWQGHVLREGGAYTDATIDADIVGWNNATIKDAAGTMHKITAPVGTNDLNHKTFYYTVTDGTGYRHHYGAYHEVTDIVKNSYTSAQNTFTVGNIKTTAGRDDGEYVYIAQAPTYSGNYQFGLYGGWSLLIVYNVDGTTAFANNVAMKTVSIFDGFDLYLTWGPDGTAFETTIDVSGFITPKTGTVNSKLLLFGGAGDRHLTPDTLQIQNQKNVGTYSNLTNTPNPVGGQFNHTYTKFGNHMTPGDTNKQGMDLDIFDVSSQMDNEQTNTKLKFGVVKNGGCDQIFPQVIAFSTELYEPQFCYDYAYSQQGIYFTENNDGTKDPDLIGDVITDSPVEVKIFIRNLVSDFAITDMTVNITDINTTQASYETDSTKLAKIGNLIPTSLNDAADLNVTTTGNMTSIKSINIGNMTSYDHFYVYYSLDPKQNLDMPINVDATYNLVVNASTIIPYTLKLGANVPMCSDANYAYSPAKGRFNVVHNSYYDLDVGGTKDDYNLPTQVTSRTGNFKVISVDENATDTLKNVSTIAAVEMIDSSAFHDVNASCQELASSISEKVWVLFDGNVTSTQFNDAAIQSAISNNMTSLTTSSEFYKNARQNAAFRVSFNLTNDGNDDLVKVEPGSKANTYKINFTELVQNLGTCAKDMDGIPNNTDTVAQWCSNNSDKLTKEDIAICMECVYGFNTKLVCSRDNFSIRPEAIMVHIDDQDQTTPTSQSRLTTGESGVVGAVSSIQNLAADYEYNLELNATNHINNTSSYGYTRSFNIATLNDEALYAWEPRGLSPAQLITRNLACNDDTNKSLDIRFVNGKVDANTSIQEVGEYSLSLLDRTWTAVDSDPIYMGHHTGSHFSSNLDCTLNSSRTYPINTAIDFTSTTTLANTLTGCEISSNHTNPTTNVKYNDYNVTFHPYEFTLLTTTTIGMGNITPPLLKPFVYMADISQDENVSVHLNTSITARGKTTATGLSNFVTGCYAKPLDINITKSAMINTQLEYKYRVHDLNSTNDIITANDINGSIPKGSTTLSPNFTTTSGYFQKNMNGTINTTANLNFSRDANATANPESITFITYAAGDPNNSFKADLNPSKTADGNSTINQTITHYYGRTNTPKKSVVCKSVPCQTNTDPNPANNPDFTRVFMYFEVFCNGTLNGNTCIPALLPNATFNTNDIRWWTNNSHDQSVTNGTDGIMGIISEVNGNTNVTDINQTALLKYQYETILRYNSAASPAFPYTGNMQNAASRWLIYDESNINATTNKFRVDFMRQAGWSGKHETDATTQTRGAVKVNKRSMW
ncbi:hypothetical protein SMGD1_0815 [Sulfurimonas gotlandica GD1]|uniref:Uncharacterized protein n=1 Tax=Sulfurimonas gotlandica (strain DSM 19862 / JCM 16533 / GD1) TaxID=929558 RepID=B6BM80_SULGG|nr:hypothetical protein [Sulfurimonas gotlandica]EDZ61871.1 conserved hypothetical protein [Sulfurimonas gotlandica GD1]EHP29342.1 hypothetical protein SMGD1_0815 [Sulfurimonas gotlandica GD1]